MASDPLDSLDPTTPGKGPLDSFFLNTPLWVIAALASFFCCPLLGLVLGLVGMLTGRSPTAKRNATVVLVVAAVSLVLNVVLYSSGVLVLPAGVGGPAPAPAPAIK